LLQLRTVTGSLKVFKIQNDQIHIVLNTVRALWI